MIQCGGLRRFGNNGLANHQSLDFFGLCRRFLQIKQSRCFMGDLRLNPFSLRLKADRQARVAHQVNETRDSLSVNVDGVDGSCGKGRGARKSGGNQSLDNVDSCFLQSERANLAASSDPLLQGSRGRLIQQRQKLRLTQENYLEKLSPRSVNIAKQTNFFQQLEAQKMRFVDKEHARAVPPVHLAKHLFKGQQTLRLAGRFALDLELIQQQLEEFIAGERRVHNQRRRAIRLADSTLREQFEKGMNQRGFARTHGAGDNGETFSQNYVKQ